MADRFFSEGSDRTNVTPDNKPKAQYPKSPRGDRRHIENIVSDTVSKPTAQSAAKKSQKFEVHINNFGAVMSQASSGTQRRQSPPLAQKPNNDSGKRPVGQSTGKVYASNRPSAGGTATGRPSSGSAAKKTAGKRAQANTPQSRAALAAKKLRRARKRMRRRYDFVKGMLIAGVCLVFVTAITVGVSSIAFSVINDVFVLSDDQNRTVTVEIPEGAGYDEVFAILNENGLIRQPYLTDFFCRFRHYDKVNVKDSETGEIVPKPIEYEAGIYYLEKNAGIEKILETIMVKKNVYKDTVRLTFPEGWSVAQIFEKIEKYGVCSADKLYANLNIIGEQYGFISEITPESGRYLKAEGFLFPDTYDFYIDESPSSVLKKLFNNFEAKWTQEFDDRARELGLTIDEVINIAAMIQREAKDSSQMAVISSVLHNRLANSGTYPYLEMNSTKDYITSLKEYELFTDFYYETYLNSYNTYSVTGLPPGPICNPGVTAIKAALYPSDTDYYFFCHSNTGEIYLAETADEHQANTEKVIYGNFEG